MIPMSSAEVIAAVAGTALAPLSDSEVTGAVIDTRAITPGALFAAVKGARVDANTLSGQARAAEPASFSPKTARQPWPAAPKLSVLSWSIISPRRSDAWPGIILSWLANSIPTCGLSR